jgi:hypothetical protein
MSSEDTVALEREILRTHISRRDFHKASQFISAASACDNNVVREALLISAVIYYTRPFSHDEKRRRAIGDSSPLAADANSAGALIVDRPLHERLLVLRDKAVCEAPEDAGPVELEPSRRGQSAKMVFTPHGLRSRTWSLLKEDIDLGAFSRLVDAMHGQCSERLQNLSDLLAEAQPFLSGIDLS